MMPGFFLTILVVLLQVSVLVADDHGYGAVELSLAQRPGVLLSETDLTHLSLDRPALMGLQEHLQWMFMACVLIAVVAAGLALLLGALASRVGASDTALERLGRWIGAFLVATLLGQSAMEQWGQLTTQLWTVVLPQRLKLSSAQTSGLFNVSEESADDDGEAVDRKGAQPEGSGGKSKGSGVSGVSDVAADEPSANESKRPMFRDQARQNGVSP